MKIAVIGSRGFSDYEKFSECIEHFTKNVKEEITFISGAASSGADFLIAKYCKENNLPIIEFPADWNKHGKAAGPIRNKLIIEEADAAIAFWNQESRGTKHSIGLAEKKGIPIRIVKI